MNDNGMLNQAKMELIGCRNQCIDFCLAESLQERVAELQAQLERYKAVMDGVAEALQRLCDCVNYEQESGAILSQCDAAIASYNTLKGE